MIAAFFSTHTLDHLLGKYGYAAVYVFVMVESLGIPFPGETMVIAAAVYAGATHSLSIWVIWAVAAAGAIVGDNIGFGIGHWGGYRLLRRYGSKLRLNEAKLKVGRLIFDRHGGKVVFFGRFVSILRTYAAFLAGTNRMEYLRFLFFNASGGIVWSAVYAFGFYYLGAQLEKARGPVDYGLGAAAVVIVVAFIVWIRRHEKRLEIEAERVYPGPLDDHMARGSSEAAPATVRPPEPPSDDAGQDEDTDDDQHQRGEEVAPPLQPDPPDLVTPASGGEGQPDDRGDRDSGEDDQRAHGDGPAHRGSGEEYREDG
jgi:membrane protein DedA with SNARE-associated domain